MRFQRRFADGLESLVLSVYRLVLAFSFRNGYVVVASFIALIMICALMSVIPFGCVAAIFGPLLQAQILMPVAVSLAFGILFATVITLLLIPSLYLLIDDALRLLIALYRPALTDGLDDQSHWLKEPAPPALEREAPTLSR